MKPYLALCRIALSLFAAFSAATGFFLGPYHRLTDVLPSTAAVFLLACGASALNQYQERDIDAKMERTKRRPLPSGIIAPVRALLFSLVLILSGLTLLALAGGLKPFALGLFALFWYNLIYTYLKRITAFASVPGAAVGTIPVAIGWVSAGGIQAAPQLAVVCFVFFMWQIPHFWLLLLRSGNDYQKAGLPSLCGIMHPEQISRVTFVWLFAASVSCLLLPLYGAIRTPLVYFSLVPPAVWLVWGARFLIRKQALVPAFSGLFQRTNIFLFLVMSSLSLDNILFRAP
jgi:protoheme IX farnesyltransferase